MPAYYRAEQFLAWERLLSERPRQQWESPLLAFVAPAALRPPRANGCRSKLGKQEQRARRRRQGFRFCHGLAGEREIRLGSAAWSALRSFLVPEWSSHFPRSMSLIILNSC